LTGLNVLLRRLLGGRKIEQFVTPDFRRGDRRILTRRSA
jgi:hypothetical protein